MTRADFDDFVRRISRKIYVQAYHILNDRQGAEDAVQEVFIRLWNMKSRLNEYKSVEALAATITRNHCIDQLRKIRIHETGTEENLLSYHSSEPSPHQILEINETTTIIERIIEKMPEIYQRIIHLRDIEGLSYEEIAIETNQNINTLRVNLSRARRLIRTEYEKQMHEKR